MILFQFLIIIFLVLIILYPLFKRKYNKLKFLKFSKLVIIKEDLLEKGLFMLNSEKTFMSFCDERSLYTFLANIKSILKGNKNHGNYAYYNFPKAFLILGLIDEYNKTKSEKLLQNILEKVDEKYVTEEGLLRFKFDKIDQVVFGLIFIRLFKITSKEKYLIAVDTILSKINEFKNIQNFYLYRKESKILFIDTLGMVVPFLIEYGNTFNKQNYIDDGIFQIKEYISLTTSNKLEFPTHAFDLDNQIKLGSNNWSRGMGWFMIGLSYAAKNDEDLKKIFNHYYQKMLKISKDNYWPQFFSHSNDSSIDASATIMIYYSASILDIDVIDKVNTALIQSISKDYFVENNSGDTIYINRYALNKSKSELSQGLLISILSKY